ncbi:MAG: glycosyltransferase family 2 protein [Phycisphaerales bacterium]|nr:glycosyltransferase family 2 protein [Phycisphaerales bacterium]
MSEPLPLSAAIVCRNNDDTIERTLASVRPLCAEIVALDSGSTDGTIGLLERFGARVDRVSWRGHIATKQAALESCTQPWVLCIDSDESIEPDLAASIRASLAGAADDLAGLMVNRKVWYDGRYLDHAWQPEWRLRLVRRALVPGQARWGGVDPHDKLEVQGRVERVAGTMRHDTVRGLGRFLAAQVSLAQASARSLHAAGRRGSRWRLIASPPGAFVKQIVMKRAFLDGWRGWCAAGSAAAGALMKHAMLLDLDRAARERAHPGPGTGGA